MAVSIVNQSNQSITLQVTIPFTRSMLDSESIIQDAVNQAGSIATQELLRTFDTDGEALQLGSVKMTTKGQVLKRRSKRYQSGWTVHACSCVAAPIAKPWSAL